MELNRRQFLGTVLASAASTSAAGVPTLGSLRCEYLSNPLGIDIQAPGLSWAIDSAREGEKQTAYQILVTSPEGEVWDSGKVNSDRTTQVVYAGPTLRSRQRCDWKVRFWDGAGQVSQWSQEAFWEMGLLEKGDWAAHWITGNRIENQADPVTGPAPWFRYEFDLPADVTRARVYFCGLGFSELYLNGKKVGDHVLSPNQTDYDDRRLGKLLYPFDNQTSKRVLYVVHDVGDWLKPGRNAVGVALGNGWYNQRDRIVEALSWYGSPRLLFQLEAQRGNGTGDGTKVIVTSQENWKVSTGPILHDGIFTGETYDARLELPGWSTAGYDDAAWTSALPASAPKGVLRAQMGPPDRVTRIIRPVAMKEVRPGVYSFDAGENLAGWAKVTLRGPKGRHLTLRFLEELGPDFHQADHYILRGGSAETWEPRFTWHGFRHMEMIGAAAKPALEDVEFRSVHSDVAPAGEFECSDALLTRLFANYRRTQLANMHCGVPSDCPHRERLGYTGDGQIASEAAIYTLDMAAFYAKWIQDILDSQNRNTGFVPHTAPFEGGAGGYAWGSAIVIVPWRFYLYYGDARLLAAAYPSMLRWLDYCTSKTGPDGIIETEEPGSVWIGDWSAPLKKMADPSLVNTAYYAHCVSTVAAIAGALDRWEEAGKLHARRQQICEAINRRFYQPDKSQYSEGIHGCNFFALGLGVVPPEHVSAVLERGISLLGHFDTGFIGTPFVLKTLARHRRTDVAFRLMTQTTFPSFNDAIGSGATTVWENWNRGSHNHPMFGAVCAWLFQSLAGINPDPANAGFRRIRMRPEFVPQLKNVKASYRSIAGLVTSEWEQRDDAYELKIQIPPNCTAIVELPDRAETPVAAGQHKFRVRVE